MRNRFVTVTVITTAALSAILGADLSNRGTPAQAEPVQTYTAPSDTVTAPIVRDRFTVTDSAHLPKCIEEDSHDCIWNAGTSGNKVGQSFIDYHGHVYYLDSEYDY